MASIWKHPKSKFWTACFTDAGGKQRKRTTKLTDRKKAHKVAEGWEAEYRNIRAEEQTRKVFADIRREIHGDTTLDQSIEQFFAEWLAVKKREIGSATWKKYEHAQRHFCEWLGESRKNDISYVTPTLIRKWRDELAEKLAPKTVNNMLKVLGVAFSHAYNSEQIVSNPVSKVKSLKLDRVTRRAFTLDELKRVLNACDEEWRGVVLMGLYTGQRLRDVACLLWGAVDLDKEEVYFITSKTGRTVSIPIAAPLLEYLKSLPTPIDGTVPILPSSCEVVTRQGRTSALSTRFHTILVEAGLAQPHIKKATGEGRAVPRERGGLSFHCLRHTATSLLKNAGVSESVAMDIIGHDSKEISAVYTHIESSAKRKAMNKLPDITKG